MFNRAGGVGLDIGSRKIKLAKVKRRGYQLQLLKYGGMPAPAGMVEGGSILDPEELGKELSGLVNKLGLHGQKVVSAVSGQQVYICNLILPRMSRQESREAAIYQAVTFLPIPIEEAAIDVFPWRNFEDNEGKKSELFFAAVPKVQVDNLNTVCQAAGLKLVAVELEPLVIKRILTPDNESGVMAILQIDASRCYFSVFSGEILIFYRTMVSFYDHIERVTAEEIWDTINITQESPFKHVAGEFITEVCRSVEYYNINYEKKLEKIWLCCGSAGMMGLAAMLAAEITCNVETANFLPRIILPNDLDERLKQELNYDFPVALGLAAREVI